MEFDPAKDAENVRKHGISLARASDFELGSAQLWSGTIAGSMEKTD